MYFMSSIFLKGNIDGVPVPQFQLVYICDTTHPSHKHLVKLFHEVHYMRCLNKYLELQDWEDLIKSHKTIILAVIMLVPNKNPQRYKERVILFISFTFGEGVTIIDLIEKMELYVSDV